MTTLYKPLTTIKESLENHPDVIAWRKEFEHSDSSEQSLREKLRQQAVQGIKQQNINKKLPMDNIIEKQSEIKEKKEEDIQILQSHIIEKQSKIKEDINIQSIENQFDDNCIFAAPDPKKEYTCFDSFTIVDGIEFKEIQKKESKGFTKLMKWVLLTKKNPILEEKIRKYLIKHPKEVFKQNDCGFSSLMLVLYNMKRTSTTNTLKIIIDTMIKNSELVDISKYIMMISEALEISIKYMGPLCDIDIFEIIIDADINSSLCKANSITKRIDNLCFLGIIWDKSTNYLKILNNYYDIYVSEFFSIPSIDARAHIYCIFTLLRTKMKILDEKRVCVLNYIVNAV